MVHVTTPRPNVGAALGNALGGIGGQIAGNEFGYQRNRSRLQGALGEVEELAKPKEGQPPASGFQIGLGLMKALAGIPGSERYVGQILPMMIQESQRRHSTENPPYQSGLGPQGQPTQHQVGEGQDTPASPENLSVFSVLPPQGNPLSASTQDIGTLPSLSVPYPPEAFQKIRQISRERAYTPEMEERLIKDAQEVNQASRDQYRDLQATYGQKRQEKEDQLKLFNETRNEITKTVPEAGGGTKSEFDPDEQALALKFAEDYIQGGKGGSPRAVMQHVRDQLRPYQAAKNALKDALKRPLFGMTEKQKELARSRAQMMIDMGQKDQLRLMIANAGHGDVEEAQLLNPLSKDEESYFSGLNKVKSPLHYVTTTDPESPKYQKELDTGRKVRQATDEKQIDKLSELIKPGTYKNPGTNLLLTRRGLSEAGYNWQEAAEIIDSAIQKGNIKLDPYQQIDYQKLGYPPLTAKNYLKNVFDYVIFGRE